MKRKSAQPVVVVAPRRDENAEEEEIYYIEEPQQKGLIQSGFSNFLLTIKNTILKPFFMGASGAFGISLGYTLYDFLALHAKNWAVIKALTAKQ